MARRVSAVVLLLSLVGWSHAQIEVHSFDGGRDQVEGVSAFDGEDEVGQSESDGTAPDVVMYSASWCGVCARAREFFLANNIPFSEYDVEKTRRGQADYRELGGTGVPVILVGDYLMQGFSQQRFMRLYHQ